MRRGHAGFALSIVLSCGMGANSQLANPSGTAPETLRTHLRNERFAPLTTVAALPARLREALSALFDSATLDMADPGQPFQATDVMVTPRLPSRRLIAAGCSADHCLVYYERGGFVHVQYAVVFKVSAKETRFEFGGAASGGLRDLDAVKQAVVSGQVLAQGASKYW